MRSEGAADPDMSHSEARRAILRRVGQYLVWFLLPLVLFSWGIRRRPPQPNVLGVLPEKLAWYAERTDAYDLVFVGDSRTYCGVHPNLIDPQLGTRSVNLALWAHWFTTQVPFTRDLVALVPAGATVVWSVGATNFGPVGDAVNDTYPLSLGDAVRYMAWGLRWSQVKGNLIHYEPATRVVALAPGWRLALDAVFDRKLCPAPAAVTTGPSAPDPLLAEAERLCEASRQDPDVALARPVFHDGRVTSVELLEATGGAVRIELDPDFFRRQQQDLVRRQQAVELQPFEPHSFNLAAFEAMLDTYREAGVHLVVNEIEEAPCMYPRGQGEHRAFMREVVQPLVEARGFAYVRVDFDQLSDADYFDYNHLNSRGIVTYDRLLAEALEPHLKRE